MLEDKARDLGRQIGQTPEYQAVKRANDALTGDRDAITLLRDLEKLRLDAARMIEKGQEPTPEMEKQLDELLAKAQGNPLYQQVVVAQSNFDKLMMRVNEWIMDGIAKGAASPIITLG